MVIHTHNDAETKNAAMQIAKKLRPGDVIAFTGGMGMGKTTFIAGLVRGLGIDAYVSSPTFALVHEYRGNGVSLCHFDMFRVEDMDDLYSTGFFDYLDGERILAVEWSEKIPEALPLGHISIDISPGEGEEDRIIIVTGDERFETACS